MSKRTKARWRAERARPPPSPPDVPPIAGGGQGGGSAPAREETAVDGGAGLAARASAKSWSVSGRAALTEMIRQIASDPTKKPRERIAAFRAILMAERLDLESIKTTMVARDHETGDEELAALEARLEQQAKAKSNSASR